MSTHHITIGICTFRRERMLADLLKKLTHLERDQNLIYSILVVDNDEKQSARKTVNDFAATSNMHVTYICQPQKNIALARNTVLENATGDYIAFIDDDEFPARAWLTNLLATCMKYNATGVLGPVRPFFPHTPPRWLEESGLCQRPSYPTGTRLSWQQTRTGNVLLSAAATVGKGFRFNPKFAIQGEDQDFFKRLMAAGHTFVWCEEAPVYEIVPQERLEKSYHIRRAWVQGAASSEHIKNAPLEKKLLTTGKSLTAAILYTALLPALYLTSAAYFMKFLVKDIHHISRILALTGVNNTKFFNFR